MATIIVPGTHTGWSNEVWERGFEEATYQRQKLIPVIDEHERLYSLLHVRKAARLVGSTLSQTSDGTGLNYLNPIDTPVTLTPIASVVPVGWSINEEVQIDVNLERVAPAVEQALAELTETTVATNAASFTNVLSAADVSANMLRKAYGILMGNTNGLATPGGQETVYGFFTHTQYPVLGDIPEFNQADIRGDSENPYVRGIWTKGGGIMLLMSTVVYNDGSAWNNLLFHPSAIGISWNKRSMVKKDDAELQERRIAYNNVGSGVIHNLRAVLLKTTNNANA